MNINEVDRTNPSDFRLFLWSDLVAQIAGVGAGLAIPVVTLRLSDSLTLAGLYGTITGIAALAGGIIGGSLADMWRRKPLIIVTNALAGVLNLALASLILSGSFSPMVFGALLGSMMFFYRIGQACSDPCLPQLVEEEQLAAKQGIIQARLQFAGLIGPTVGGALLEVNVALPFVFVGLANILTIVFFLFIRARLDPTKKAENKLLRTTKEGLAIVARAPLLRGLIAMQTLSNCAINGSLFMAVLILEEGNNPGWVTGLARTSIGLIGIVGGFVDGLVAEEVLLRHPSGRHMRLGCCINRLWCPAQPQPVDDHPLRAVCSYSPSRRRGNLCRTPQASGRRNFWPSHQYPNEHRRFTL